MAYASLTFSTSVSYQQALHDIIGCVTGAYTSTSQFKYASGTLVRGGGDWTIAYAPAAVTYNAATYQSTFNHVVLSATCTTGSKTKYAHVGTWYGTSGGYIATDTGFLGASGVYNSGLFITAATAASSATALTNETFRQTFSSSNSTSYVGLKANGITFYLSWSSKHLVWYNSGICNTGTSFIQGVIEFPEVTKTTTVGSLPVVWMHCINSYSTSLPTSLTESGGTQAVTVPANNVQINSPQIVNTFIFPSLTTDTLGNNVANYLTVTTAPVDYLLSPFMSSGGTISYANTENFSALGSDGINKTLVTPIQLSGLTFGYDIMDLTAYTSMYTISLGTTGDIVSIGGQDYIVMALTNGKRFLFKKG